MNTDQYESTGEAQLSQITTIPTNLYLNHRKSQIREIILHKFYPLDYLERDQLSSDGYFILYWSGRYFQAIMREGQINKSEVSYGVIYHNCTPEQAFSADQLALSFRAPLDPSICGPKVLVKVVRK